MMVGYLIPVQIACHATRVQTGKPFLGQERANIDLTARNPSGAPTSAMLTTSFSGQTLLYRIRHAHFSSRASIEHVVIDSRRAGQKSTSKERNSHRLRVRRMIWLRT